MIKFFTPVGWVAYQTTDYETHLFGGAGICDECGTHVPVGYLVPVLNHWQCPKCFAEWMMSSKFYPSDVDFEKSYIDYYEKIIPVDYAGYLIKLEGVSLW